MPALKSLSITVLPKTLDDPTLIRRNKLITRLEEQQRLIDDPAHVRIVERWAEKDGERTLTTKHQKVRPWWRADASSQLFMSVKFGNKPLEFEKGKAAIAVGSKENLPKVIATLLEATRAGELDEIIGQASKKQPGAKARRSA